VFGVTSKNGESDRENYPLKSLRKIHFRSKNLSPQLHRETPRPEGRGHTNMESGSWTSRKNEDNSRATREVELTQMSFFADVAHARSDSGESEFPNNQLQEERAIQGVEPQREVGRGTDRSAKNGDIRPAKSDQLNSTVDTRKRQPSKIDKIKKDNPCAASPRRKNSRLGQAKNSLHPTNQDREQTSKRTNKAYNTNHDGRHQLPLAHTHRPP
jgi:hypothetical protein